MNVSVEAATGIEERKRERAEQRMCSPDVTLQKKASAQSDSSFLPLLLTEFATSSSSSSTRRRGAEPLGPGATAAAADASILECGTRRRQRERGREAREREIFSLHVEFCVETVFLFRLKEKKNFTTTERRRNTGKARWKKSVVYKLRERRSPYPQQ